MEPLFLDIELARRVELAEAQAAATATSAGSRTQSGIPRAVEHIAGGFAVYCGANSPVTQAVALGLHGPVSEEEFQQLETFYRSRNEPVRIETCPLADLTLFEHLGKHGYRATEFTNVMARRIGRGEEFTVYGNDVSIERVAEKQIDLWTLTVAQGFAESLPVSQEILDIMKMFALAPGNECYLARLDGKVAGGATLSLRDGIAGLFGASTLPAYRKRGVQSALLAARLARAAEAGCDLAACLAQPGSVSQRNILRSGFQVLYTRVKYERSWEERE
jgi:GNAT superfamily N-acetyltransferase